MLLRAALTVAAVGVVVKLIGILVLTFIVRSFLRIMLLGQMAVLIRLVLLVMELMLRLWLQMRLRLLVIRLAAMKALVLRVLTMLMLH